MVEGLHHRTVNCGQDDAWIRKQKLKSQPPEYSPAEAISCCQQYGSGGESFGSWNDYRHDLAALCGAPASCVRDEDKTAWSFKDYLRRKHHEKRSSQLAGSTLQKEKCRLNKIDGAISGLFWNPSSNFRPPAHTVRRLLDEEPEVLILVEASDFYRSPWRHYGGRTKPPIAVLAAKKSPIHAHDPVPVCRNIHGVSGGALG